MSNGRIMIVEDESLVAEDLHNCLMRSGYDVVGVADSYASAKALAELPLGPIFWQAVHCRSNITVARLAG